MNKEGTNREWGDGTEDPEIFNPTEFDARQWVEAAKSAGMKGVILTCKHHDGFCLWPTKYTAHSVTASPWKNGQGDIVRDVADACKEYGMKFGIYLSPWDRNQPCYGNGKEYNDYYISQLTELLTGYGDIFSVWLDGACGEGPNGKKQVYDWERYYACVNTSQMHASVYADRISDGAEMKPVMCEKQSGVLFLPALHWQKAFRKRASRQTILNFVSEKSPVIWKTLEAGKS